MQVSRKRALGALVVVGMCIGGAAIAQQAPTYTLVAGGGFAENQLATAANLHGAADIVFDDAGNAYISQTNGNRIRKVSAAGVITTIVGGTTGFSGDYGPASAAAINRPMGLARDIAGNLYFSDTGNHRVRKIAPNGLITTIAGNGGLVHAGDGGLAVNAGIASPSGLAVDGAGNLYIADTLSHRVRKVSVDGMISTVAGTGTASYTGDFGPATSATLDGPLGVDVDASGNLYIADTDNSAIRKVAANGQITTHLFSEAMYPLNVAVDASGAVYTGHLNHCTLLKFTGGDPVRVAGVSDNCMEGASGGIATETSIGAPDGIAFDTVGNLVFVDTDYARVRKVTTASGQISLFAGTGGYVPNGSGALAAPMSAGMALAVEADGDIVLSDALVYRRVRRISAAGAVYNITGNGSFASEGQCQSPGLPCPASQLAFPNAYGVAIGANGNVLVADHSWNYLVSIDTAGNASLFAGTTRAAGTGNGDGGPAIAASMDPWGIARDNSGNTYIADNKSHRIRRIEPGGTITTWAGTGAPGFSGDNGPATSAQINLPMAVATDEQGNVYFSESGNKRVRKVTVAGLITTIAGNGVNGVTGDGGPAVDAAVGSVDGIAVDDTGVVYLSSNGRLRRILANGTIESLSGWNQYAMSLAIRNGQLYIATREGQVYRTPVAEARRVENDYDGDGRSDLLWRNAQTGGAIAWKAADSASVVDVMDVTNTAWKIVGQGDFDGDLTSDIVWRNGQTGANAIWLAGNYATQFPVAGVNNLAWTLAGVGDFDGDNRADLLWRNGANGQNAIWRAGAAANQLPATAVTNLQWTIVGVGDFDGDHSADILWRNTTTGINAIWRSGNSATQLPISGVTNLAWKIQGVGDFDGDGKSDIFWRNTANGINAIWRSGNSATQLPVVGVTSQLWRVVAVGDYDEDGKSDLVWRNTGNGTNTVWRSGDAATQIPVTGVTNQAWSIVPYTNQR